jgi:hypothetical protein
VRTPPTKPHGAKHEKATPHTLRHWFTTHLHRAKMRREHLKILRADVLSEAVDIYTAIDYDELRADYLAASPASPAVLPPTCPARRSARIPRPPLHRRERRDPTPVPKIGLVRDRLERLRASSVVLRAVRFVGRVLPDDGVHIEPVRES